VETKNETSMIIPIRLQNDLLDFNTYGLDNKWTTYHGNKQKGVNYDYGILLSFREILISPEQIKEKEFIKERQIKDGQKKLLDAKGKEVIDNTGKPVMVDNLRNVTIRINETRQFKSSQISVKVDYIDFKKNQLIQSFPLTNEYIFENIYSNFNGDKRASDDNYYSYFDKKAVPFPTNEQMIYNTGENLKTKLKDLLNRNTFRN